MLTMNNWMKDLIPTDYPGIWRTKTGFRVRVRPDGAFYVYCDVSGVCDDSFALAHRLLHEAHVALTPGRDFGFNRPGEHVRIAYTQDIPRLREACARIRAALA